MGETLELKYNAKVPSVLVTVDALNENGVRLVGGPPDPVVHLTLAELGAAGAAANDPTLLSDLESVLKRIEPVARAAAVARSSDPQTIAVEAARVAREGHRLATQQALSAGLDSAIAAKQAHLDALEKAAADKLL